MADEPDNLVSQLFRQLREDMAATQSLTRLRHADVASDVIATQAKNEAGHKARIRGLAQKVETSDA